MHGFGQNPTGDTNHGETVHIATTNGGCSGTWIRKDLVLTAAHCVADIAQGCKTAEDVIVSLNGNGGVTFTRSGQLDVVATSAYDTKAPSADTVRFNVNGIAIHDGAYPNPMGAAGCANAANIPDGQTWQLDASGMRVLDAQGNPIPVTTNEGVAANDVAILHIDRTGVPDNVPYFTTPEKVFIGTYRTAMWTDSWSLLDWLRTSVFTTPPAGSSFWQYGFGMDDRALIPNPPPFRLGGNVNLLGWPAKDGDMIAIGRLNNGTFADHGDSGSGLHAFASLYGNGSTQGANDAPMTIGVCSRGEISVGQGSAGKDGTDYRTGFTPTFTPSNAQWIELHLRDFDGDGVDDSADNCYRAWNPDQTNCNLDAENAAITRSDKNAAGDPIIHRGDACDPVPCPEAKQLPPVSGAPTCPKAGIGDVIMCSGRSVSNQFSTTGHGPNKVYSHATAANVAPLGMHLADKIDTSFSFCQQNKDEGSDCRDATIMTNDLVKGRDLRTTDPMFSQRPYHRMTTRIVGAASWNARGAAYNLDYGQGFSNFEWNYTADNTAWIRDGMLVDVDSSRYRQCHDVFHPGPGTCLDGVLLTHAKTPIGDTVSSVTNAEVSLPGAGEVMLGVAGANLSNTFLDMRPDEAWTMANSGGQVHAWDPPVWCDPDPLATLSNPLTTVTNPVTSVVNPGLFSTVKTPISVTATMDIVATQPTGAITNVTHRFSTSARQLVASPRTLLVAPAEPLPGGAAHRIGVAVSSDGSRLIDAVLVNGQGEFSLASESAANRVVDAGNGPEPRSGFATVYSDSLDSVFVIGGKDAQGRVLSEVWRGSLAGGWTNLTAKGLRLDNVVASTFVLRDRALWILDLASSGGFELLRVNTLTGETESLGSWEKHGAFSTYALRSTPNGDLWVSASGARGTMNSTITVDRPMRSGSVVADSSPSAMAKDLSSLSNLF